MGTIWRFTTTDRDIFSELIDMQQEMSRLFDECFGERRPERAEGRWLPTVDVSETDTEILVRADLPGMTQKDIEVNLQDNVLTLKGKKQQKKKEKKEHYYLEERSYGRFNQSFTLPARVDEEKVKATLKYFKVK